MEQVVDSILVRVRVYRDVYRVRHEVLSVISSFPSLTPSTGSPVNGPSSQTILTLTGTVPILYNGVQYNIPIALHLLPEFPHGIGPQCYVVPTASMVVSPQHRHVDSRGFVYLPYLSSWGPSSSLLGCVQAMRTAFSEDPPVRSASPAPVPPPVPARPTSAPAPPLPPKPIQFAQQPYSSSSLQPQQAATQRQDVAPPYSPAPPMQDETAAKKQVLVQRVQTRLHDFQSACTKEIDALMAKHGELEARGRALDVEKASFLSQKESYATDVESLTQKVQDLLLWLDANDKPSDVVDVDALTTPKDVVRNQLLTLVAHDAALEDTIYFLEKSLGRADVTLDMFLKAIRSLSTEQFFQRALIKKIHECG